MTDVLTVPIAPAAPAPDRVSTAAFVDAEIRPYADAWDRAGAIPVALQERLGETGLWAPFLPPELGGAGVSLSTLGEIHEEVGRGCSSVRSLLTVHSMLSWALMRFGTPDQIRHWGPRLATGALTGAFCLSEPGTGSDAAGITTTATPDGDGWVLDGVKTWTTGGQRAGLFLVFARGPGGTVCLLVPRATPGVSVTPIDDMLGTRSSMLATIQFDQVRLGPESTLGPTGFTSGMVLTGVLDIGRFSVACGSVGIVQGCLDACAAYSASRTVAGARLRDLPLIQAKLSDMVTDVRAGRLLCAEAGRLKDAGDAGTIMATWIAKYFASTAAARHASEAVQIHGANGFTPDYPVARFYRDAKVMEIIEGSNEIQRLTIAGEAHRRWTR